MHHNAPKRTVIYPLRYKVKLSKTLNFRSCIGVTSWRSKSEPENATENIYDYNINQPLLVIFTGSLKTLYTDNVSRDKLMEKQLL